MRIHLFDPALCELSLQDGATVAVPKAILRRFRFTRQAVERTRVLVGLWAVSGGLIKPVDEVRVTE